MLPVGVPSAVANFYPRSPRGERQRLHRLVRFLGSISIHAPREGSDSNFRSCPAPGFRFLSTLPARGATLCTPPRSSPWPYFYPRSPRGERQHILEADARGGTHFYPRSPRGERRDNANLLNMLSADFYPRSPRGERPGQSSHSGKSWRISIHAPREGSDV